MSTLLEMKGISKAFNGVPALKDVQFDLKRGEVHCLLGENGAGKSTLIKILGGIYSKDSGNIFIDGEEENINSVKDAEHYGISIIHQELLMLPQMAVFENIFLGKEINSKGFINRNEMIKKTDELLKSFNMNISPTEKLSKLTIGQQQVIEIIRAVSFGAKIIVMDEPTSSLSENEVSFLFEIIRKLRKDNVGIVYISHRLSELYEIGDRVTVFRDGTYISTDNIADVSRDDLIYKMVGRKLENYYVCTHTPSDEVVMEAKDYSDGKRVKDASFELHKGEILGFAGLVGAGRSELMSAIFGVTQKKTGTLTIKGKPVEIHSVHDAMKAGIGFVPEDRKLDALYMAQNVRYNMTIEVMDRFLKAGHYNPAEELNIVNKYADKMHIKMAGVSQKVVGLSGGNQQKVVIGRWLATAPDILILDEPTRGVDVGAKAEIYDIVDKLAKEGVAIIFVSSDLPEVLGMSDRIVVMSEGCVKGILTKEEASQEKIMDLATTEE